jgi:hypothetical protein
MRSHTTNRGLRQFIECLTQKWSGFWEDVLLAIAEEEMRIRREQFDKQVGPSHGERSCDVMLRGSGDRTLHRF